MPDARDQVMRRLAQQQLYDLKASEVFDELDPGALQGLRRDGLVRDPPDAPWAVLPEFSHEMVRTFALAQVLLADGEPVDELLAAGSPRWALPAARTAAQAQLAAADSSTFPIGGRLRRVQTSFDRLVTAGHGERWSDLPIEAALALPNAGLLLGSIWDDLASSGGDGIGRLLRIVRQRHSPGGLVSVVTAEPVVRLLLEHGWPHQINGDSEELLRDWLGALLIAEVAEGSELRIALRDRLVESVTEGDRQLVEIREQRAAELAARTPEQVKEDEEQQKRFGLIGEISGIRRRRRWVELPPQLTDESTIEKLALLGPDLGGNGAELLRRVARDAPNRLAPALEEALTDRGLAMYRPSFLTELAMAYYVDDEEDDEYGGGFTDDGIRHHHWRGPVSPLAAYYRGPFLVMFHSDFRNAVAFTNARC